MSRKDRDYFYHNQRSVLTIGVVQRWSLDVVGDVVEVGAVEATLRHLLLDVEFKEFRDVVEQSQQHHGKYERSTGVNSPAKYKLSLILDCLLLT